MSGHAGMVQWETTDLAALGYRATSGLRWSGELCTIPTGIPHFERMVARNVLQQAWVNDDGNLRWVDVPTVTETGQSLDDKGVYDDEGDQR